MFNSRVAAHNLLPRRAETGVLKAYTVEACFVLCQTIVDGVTKSPDQTIQTRMHLNFALEAIGYSFLLPIDSRSVDIISKATKIYESWLSNIPKCAHEIEQTLIQDIVGHFSLLFHSSTPLLRIGEHSTLAMRVLEVIRAFIVNRGSCITSATWNYCIRLMLGSADCVFEAPDTGEATLGNNVAVDLSRLIYEMYIRSLPTVGIDLALWNLLDSFTRRWTHRLPIIEQWNDICINLTLHVLRYLPRVSERSSSHDGTHVSISFPKHWRPSSVEIAVLPHHLKFAWHRVLHCLGNPSFAPSHPNKELSQSQALILSQMLFGVCSICDCLLLRPHTSNAIRAEHFRELTSISSVSSASYLSTLPVDVNNVLRLMGAWLFQASLRTVGGRDTLEESRLLALDALGRMFSSRQQGRDMQILVPHRNRFLLSLRYAFDTSKEMYSKKALASALLSSHRVLGTNIEGIDIILPNCICAVEAVLKASREEYQPFTASASKRFEQARALDSEMPASTIASFNFSLANLRRSAIRLLLGVINRSSVLSAGGVRGVNSISPLNLLTDYLKSESNPRNMELILRSIPCLPLFRLYDMEQKASSDLIVAALGLLHASRATFSVKVVAIKCLADLPSCTILFDDDAWMTNSLRDLVHSILQAICDFIQVQLSSWRDSGPISCERDIPLKSKKSRTVDIDPEEAGNKDLLEYSFCALFEWVYKTLCFSFLKSQQSQSIIFKIQSTAVQYMNVMGTITPSIYTLDYVMSLSAFKLLQYTLSWSGRYPLGFEGMMPDWFNKQVLSSCAKNIDPHSCLSHYAMNNSMILSVVECSESSECNTGGEVKSATGSDMLVAVRSRDGIFAHRIFSPYSLVPKLREDSTLGKIESTPSPQSTSKIDTSVIQSKISSDGMRTVLEYCHSKSDLLMFRKHDGYTDEHSSGNFYSGNHAHRLLQTSTLGPNATNCVDMASSWYNPFRDRLKKQQEAEKAHTLSETSTSTFSGPKRFTTDSVKEIQPVLCANKRKWLGQSHLANYRNFGKIDRLKYSNNLSEELNGLDDCPTRNQYDVWIAYAANKELADNKKSVTVITDHLISATDTYDMKYINFLLGLGSLMDLDRHTGYSGDIDPNQYSGKLLYYSSVVEEMIFHQHAFELHQKPTLNTCQDYCLPRDGILKSNANVAPLPPVLVVWNQCSLQVYPDHPLWEVYELQEARHLMLFIDPIAESEVSGLYRVRVYIPDHSLYKSNTATTSVSDPGPLSDGMVVSLSQLPRLVRQTSLNVYRDISKLAHEGHSEYQSHAMSPQAARDRIVNHIRNENACSRSFPFFDTLFGTVERVSHTGRDNDSVVDVRS